MEPKINQPVKVLIIEDDLGHFFLLNKLLKKQGCICDKAKTGQEGLLMAQENAYDLIFVDIRLPDIDGFIVATRLREGGCTIPMVAVTSVSVEGLESNAIAMGFKTFLQKPLSEETVAAVLNHYTCC